MITTFLRIGWLNLRRDFVSLGLTFILPVIFFSIFAVIFGGMSSDEGARPIRVAVVNESNSDMTQKVIDALASQASLQVLQQPKATEENPNPEPYQREQAQALLRAGKVATVVIFPENFDMAFENFLAVPEVDLYFDAANPIAKHTVNGLLQAAAMQAAPDFMMKQGLAMLEQHGGALTEQQKSAVTMAQNMGAGMGLINVNNKDTQGDKQDQPTNIVSYYAASIGVMFLLFSMAGAGGSLLEEEESGTLDRLLTTNIGMGTLLLGKWSFFTILGILQLSVMFLWAALVFGVPLFTAKHLLGFAILTPLTAAAAAAFGIMLATICKTRAQLSGMSTIIILIMSALGGSMVPRYVMPAFMDTTAMFTFNGWAIDGYLKVFWREDPSHDLLASAIYLWPECTAIGGMGIGFLLIARYAAKRWETI